MFARGIAILTSSSLDVGNIPAPRPYDALAESCGRAAMRALQAPLQFMPPSARAEDPARWARIQRNRREQLEAFLWVEPNAAALERMADLLGLIASEGRWAEGGASFDDPFRPDIDLQAAETGMLFAWTLRRHGAKLAERDPRIPGALVGEVRRRLLAPLLAHEDYPFMLGEGRCPALIISDLLMSCLLMERNPSRRQQPVKLLLRLLDRLCGEGTAEFAPYAERLADACALSDLARLLKRLTRGELDLTDALPPENMLDSALIPWMAGNYFFDPTGADMQPPASGMDIFRLGHLTRDRVLCALGAQLNRVENRPSFSLNGRVLSMEYMRAAQDESASPPRMRRAAESGRMMVSRVDALTAAIAGAGARSNAGDLALFCGNTPVIVDAGGDAHSLPLIGGFSPVAWVDEVPTDADFGKDRDLMSVDLTDAYPKICPLATYQRTLITMQSDGTVRLVDAFEFTGQVQELDFRFITAQRPQPLQDGGVRLGPVDMSWDGDMIPEFADLPATPVFPDGCYLLRFKLREPTQRLICGFTFEAN